MMGIVTCGAFVLLAAIVFVAEASVHYNTDDNRYGPSLKEDISKLLPYVLNEEYFRHIDSMLKNAYKGDTTGGRLVIETNALVDTKYKTWKRNADMINSLLALPKGMNDAGR